MNKYHIALSFAGEDREYVEEVANHLRASGVDVFYDLFEEEDLWGKNLYEHLTSVYRDQALFTVMFVSQFYVEKLWGNLERKSAQARAFRESSEYILPAMFDTSVEVPGMLETTGYIDLNKKTSEKLAELIVRKLTKSGVTLEGQHAYSENVKADVDYPVKAKGKIGKIIEKLKSYNWYTQSPAISDVMSLDWSKVSSDDAFVLGRNIYQCACGEENRAKEILDNLRKELASLPEDRAIDLVNGMFFEVYFNSEGEFRGSDLKSRKLPNLLKIQNVKKFSSAIPGEPGLTYRFPVFNETEGRFSSFGPQPCSFLHEIWPSAAARPCARSRFSASRTHLSLSPAVPVCSADPWGRCKISGRAVSVVL